jgi:electron transport complex protein RnfG
MKTMVKLSAVLAAYAVVACVGLAFVYNLTAPYIAAAAKAETDAALKVVFPDAASFEELSVPLTVSGITVDNAYVAKNGDTVLGMVVKVTGNTYKTSTVLVGVNMDRTIKTVRFMANSDTPGLGTKTMASPFIDQFPAKSVDDPFKIGSDVSAISGATISSRGVFRLVQTAGLAAGEYLKKNSGGL